ncbi:MAG TPA: guanylate kinase [Usitatibacter sp.]|jgi:guanylate kinase|nr:guanylate kinase [Usitatibacter sp.]
MSGSLFVVVAPSGAGKTSLVAELLAREPRIKLSISYTTRAPREGEAHGREYHFVAREEFERMIASGDFLEHANVYGNYYGTSRRWIEAQLAGDNDVLLEIDWQGARQVRALFPRMVGIFILPPSFSELKRRLETRGKDAADVIARRLAGAREEVSHVLEFQYIIVNEAFDSAVSDLQAVVRAARLAREPQSVRLASLLAEFK